MQFINLSQGKVATLDDEDFARFAHYHWCYRGERNGGAGYAIRHAKEGKKYKTVYLHREIMGAVPSECEVIFLNHDRLDCRRANLRIVNKQEARHHHRVRSDSKSGVKGVRHDPETDSWSACIYRSGHSYHVGTYYSKEQAVNTYLQELRREMLTCTRRYQEWNDLSIPCRFSQGTPTCQQPRNNRGSNGRPRILCAKPSIAA
jgi:hypothetical protein